MGRRGIWTLEKLIEVARKYKTKRDFIQNEKSAYESARKQGYLAKVCEHMVELKRPSGYWTEERCKEAAMKYETRKEFADGCPTAYYKALSEGWLKAICSHMVTKKRKCKWESKQLAEIAKRHSNRAEFQRQDNSAYQTAKRLGILDDICSHMVSITKPKGYWTFEKCEEEAKKYITRIEYQKGSSSYQAARRNGWLDEICTHMVRGADGFHYMVYAIINQKCKKAYIGITKQQFFKRVAQHKFSAREGARNRSKEIALLQDTEYIALTDYVVVSTAVKKAESNWARKYKAKGYVVLNEDVRFGAIGISGPTYTNKGIEEEAKKYETKIAFLRGSAKYYDAARRKGILDEVCQHMKQNRKPKRYWSLEKCIEAAKRCEKISDFRINFAGAYGAGRTNGWLSEIYNKSGLR